jgi:hypothetical protein
MKGNLNNKCLMKEYIERGYSIYEYAFYDGQCVLMALHEGLICKKLQSCSIEEIKIFMEIINQEISFAFMARIDMRFDCIDSSCIQGHKFVTGSNDTVVHGVLLWEYQHLKLANIWCRAKNTHLKH